MNFYFLVPRLDEETHIELLLFSYVLLVMVLLLRTYRFTSTFIWIPTNMIEHPSDFNYRIKK